MPESAEEPVVKSEVLSQEQQASLMRRADSLRSLRIGWLGVGLIALISLLFFQQERVVAAVILATTLITFVAVVLLQRTQKTQLAGWVFVIAIDLSLLGFFLIQIQQLGVAEAFRSQVTFLALMGLAVVFAGNQIGKVAALIAAGLNSAVMLTMTFYFGPDTIRDLRPSLYVLWWLLALATWINESNLQKALDGLAAYRIGLEQRVRERTADLESANQQLHMLNKAKDEFVSSVSHELRTPITSLRMTHALLKRQLPPGGYDKNLATFQRETDRLGTMIESLLLLSSFDQAAVAFRFAQVDLNPLVEDYVTDRIMIAQEKAIELSVELESRPCLVWADEALAGEVVSILLTNAISYTPRGGKVRVKTILDHGRDRLSRGFSVEDTGLGIPPEEQPHLFSRFFRGSAAHDSQAHGTGLGLAIAKEIVDRHNGRLEVYSKGVPGEGTIFHVWLPAKSMG